MNPFVVYSKKGIRMEILENSEVSLNGRLKNEEFDQILPLIVQWSAKNIKLGDNKNPQILRQISHIQFPQLTYLYVSQNDVESIDSIHQINMPLLEEIVISCNKIIRIGNLRKGNWPFLRNLQAYENPIVDGKELAKISSKSMSCISIYFFDKKQSDQKISWICKLETRNLKKLWVQQDRIRKMQKLNINQTKIEKLLKKKYLEMRIYS